VTRENMHHGKNRDTGGGRGAIRATVYSSAKNYHSTTFPTREV